MKKVFTTGQVAKICKVAPRTVSKWFDSGRLRGYRIPGSQDRRIPREHLLRFLKEHGMPLGDLEAEVYHKILVVGADAPLLASLREQLREGDDFRIETAASGFEAGIRAESFHPDCIVIDLAVGRIEAGQIAQNLRKSQDHLSTILVALTSDEPGEELYALGLQRRLQEAVRRRPARRAGPPPDLAEEGRRALIATVRRPSPRTRPHHIRVQPDPRARGIAPAPAGRTSGSSVSLAAACAATRRTCRLDPDADRLILRPCIDRDRRRPTRRDVDSRLDPTDDATARDAPATVDGRRTLRRRPRARLGGPGGRPGRRCSPWATPGSRSTSRSTSARAGPTSRPSGSAGLAVLRPRRSSTGSSATTPSTRRSAAGCWGSPRRWASRSRSCWRGPDPVGLYVLAGRLAPALAFAVLVGLVVATRRGGTGARPGSPRGSRLASCRGSSPTPTSGPSTRSSPASGRSPCSPADRALEIATARRSAMAVAGARSGRSPC